MLRYESLAGAGVGSSPMATRSVTGSEPGVGTPALSMSALTFGSGLGMGINFSPAGLGGSQLNAAQILDGLGVSGLVPQDGEEERQRRIHAIVHALGGRWGRVGRESVERCARRLGLECLWEPDEKEARSTLSIAGNDLLVDVEWEEERVRGVVLSFPGAREEAERSAAVGAEVLRRDLVGPDQMGNMGYVGLGAFSENLGRLAGMDVLGREGVSCFEAVEGLKTALERLWVWESGRVREEKQENADKDKEAIENEVMYSRSGRPTMHGNGKIGLRLEYWRDRRLVPTRKRKADEMDIEDRSQPADSSSGEDVPTIHSLLIGCEACPASLYPSIRISDAWVSETVEKNVTLEENLFATDPSPIDWQDPPPTFKATPDSGQDAMILDSQIPSPDRLPNIRFVAHLDPPVTVPLQKAMEISTMLGSPLTQESIQFTPYLGLLVPEKAGRGVEEVLLRNYAERFERTVRAWDGDGVVTECKHRYSVLTSPQDWARTITEIPFSHPRQLVMILPLLRQWAFLGRLLRRTLGLDEAASAPAPAPPTSAKPNNNRAATRNARKRAAPRKVDRTRRPLTPPSDTDSDADSAPSNRTHASPIRPLDLSLSLAAPVNPALTIEIPHATRGSRTVTFHIGPNAGIAVEENETPGSSTVMGDGGGEGNLDDGGEGRRRKELERLGRVLAVGEDLGVVAEWALR